MTSPIERRRFLQLSAASAAGLALSSQSLLHAQEGKAKQEAQQGGEKAKPMLFKISLAEWSLHNTLFKGKLDNKDFAKTARTEFQIGAIEYVNQFFKDKAEDQAYLAELKARQEEHKVRAL